MKLEPYIIPETATDPFKAVYYKSCFNEQRRPLLIVLLWIVTGKLNLSGIISKLYKLKTNRNILSVSHRFKSHFVKILPFIWWRYGIENGDTSQAVSFKNNRQLYWSTLLRIERLRISVNVTILVYLKCFFHVLEKNLQPHKWVCE